MKLFSIKNIGIHLHASFLLILGLVGFFSVQFYENQDPTSMLGTKIWFGIVAGLFILVGMILHELAHALVSQKYGLEIINIDLGFMGAGTKLIGEAKTPGDEFRIVIAGPLMSLFLGGISLVLGMYVSFLPDSLQLLLVFTGIVNLSLGIYNLLPVFPQDGGRALRALFWKRSNNFFDATKKACRIGIIIGYVVIISGMVTIALNIGSYGIWIIFMGIGLYLSAKSALKQYVLRERVASVQIPDVMQKIGDPPIAKNLPLDQAIGSVITQYSPKYTFVEDNSQIVGVIIADLVLQTPLNIQKTMTIGDLMTALDYIPSINIVQDIREAILLIVQNTNHLPFLLVRSESNRIIGIIDEKDIEKALQGTQ